MIEIFLLTNVKQTIAMIEFYFSKMINKIIKNNFVWNDKMHTCNKQICNCKIKQYFNCWIYKYIEIQYCLFIKCDNCDKINHKSHECFILLFKIKYIACENFHKIQTTTCNKHWTKKQNKIKNNRYNFIFFCFQQNWICFLLIL